MFGPKVMGVVCHVIHVGLPLHVDGFTKGAAKQHYALFICSKFQNFSLFARHIESTDTS
jgi:hypothetical protein